MILHIDHRLSTLLRRATDVKFRKVRCDGGRVYSNWFDCVVEVWRRFAARDSRVGELILIFRRIY